jgi:hypothetical protein
VTAAWYKTFAAGAGRTELRRRTLAEIDAYRAAAATRGATWASAVTGGAGS